MQANNFKWRREGLIMRTGVLVITIFLFLNVLFFSSSTAGKERISQKQFLWERRKKTYANKLFIGSPFTDQVYIEYKKNISQRGSCMYKCMHCRWRVFRCEIKYFNEGEERKKEKRKRFRQRFKIENNSWSDFPPFVTKWISH